MKFIGQLLVHERLPATRDHDHPRASILCLLDDAYQDGQL